RAASPSPCPPNRCRRNTLRGRPGDPGSRGRSPPGDGLQSGGAVVRAGEVTDGPYIETQEVLGSYCFVETGSLAQALMEALGIIEIPDIVPTEEANEP